MNPLTEDHIINRAQGWESQGEDFIAHLVDAEGTPFTEEVSAESLNACDPRIAACLDILLAHYSDTDQRAFWLRENIRFWQEPEGLCLMHKSGELYTSASVEGIRLSSKPWAENLRVSGNWRCVNTVRTRHFTMTYLVPNKRPLDVAEVPYRWLNAHAPGWRERFDTVQSLGHFDMGASNFIFQSAEIPTMAVPAGTELLPE